MDTEEYNERDRAAWEAVRRLLAQDERGRTILALLQTDHDAGKRALEEWLAGPAARPVVATYVSGGSINNLVAIARAESVHLSVVGRRPKQPPPSIEVVVETLARETRRRWENEARIQELQTPNPLTVPWSATGLTATGETLEGVSTHLRPLVEAFSRLTHPRVVIRGGAGAGKTSLAVLFMLALLKTPGPAKVPVFLRASSWQADPVQPNRQEHLDDWVVRSLVEDFGDLEGMGDHWPDAARKLVAGRYILPVIDGLDELPDGRRRDALRAIGRTLLEGEPLVAICRTAEFAVAEEMAGVVSATAFVDLLDVTPQNASQFLRGSVVPGRRAESWHRVFAELDTNRGGELARALSTPLMIALALAVYIDEQPDADPAQLTRFGSRIDIEEHLLDEFVPSLVRRARSNVPSTDRIAGDWRPDRARHWLAFLASHLCQLQTYDLLWWTLQYSVPTVGRRIAFGLGSAVLTGLVGSVLGVFWFGPAHAGLGAVVVGIAGVISGGLTGALVGGSPPITRPFRRSFRYQWRRRSVLFWLSTGLLAAVIGLLAAGPAVGLVIGIASALTFALASRRLQSWRATIDSRQASPRSSVDDDRMVTATIAVTAGTVLALAMTLLVIASLWPSLDVAAGLVIVLTAVLAWMLVDSLRRRFWIMLVVGLWTVIWSAAAASSLARYFGGGTGMEAAAVLFLFGIPAVGLAPLLALVLVRAWPAYVVAHTWLLLSDRLPPRLVGFLEDMHRLGILRQVGAVYQFRHARLRDRLNALWLAEHPWRPLPGSPQVVRPFLHGWEAALGLIFCCPVGFATPWLTSWTRRTKVVATAAAASAWAALVVGVVWLASVAPAAPAPARTPGDPAEGVGYVIGTAIPFVLALLLPVRMFRIVSSRMRARQLAGALPPLSPDRRYWWDGSDWRDTALSTPPNAPRTPDGTLWFDGAMWRQAAEHQARA